MSITKRGGRYRVKIRDAAGNIKSVGTFRLKKDAIEAEHEAERARRTGMEVAPERILVDDLVTRYIKFTATQNRAPKYIEEIEAVQRLRISKPLGSTLVVKLTEIAVSDWLEMLATKGGRNGKALAPKTVIHAHGLLSAALTWGVERKLVNRNVCLTIHPPAPPETTVTALSEEHMTSLEGVADDSRWGNYIALSILLGARRGEMVALNRADVNFEIGQVSISKAMGQIKGRVICGPTKGKRQRTVELLEGTAVAFRRQFAQQAADKLAAPVGKWVDDPAKPIFTDELGNRLSPKAATAAYARLAKKAGLPSTRLHATRHTTATLLIHLGVDILTVSAILGHANASITMRVYGHLVAGAKRDAAKRLDDHLGARREKLASG